MKRAFNCVADAVDVETFLVCEDEEAARALGLELMRELGFSQADVVFLEHRGPGARIRLRVYVHTPGDDYAWLREAKA